MNTASSTNSISGNTDEINENILKSALDKIEKEAHGISCQGVPAISIYIYLKNKCTADVEFARLVLADAKTLSGSFQYLQDTAFQRASKSALLNSTTDGTTPVSGIGMLDTEIYEIIDNYYTLPEDEIASQKKTAEHEIVELRKKLNEIRKATDEKVDAEKPKAPIIKKEAKEKSAAAGDESETAQLSFFEGGQDDDCV